MRELLVGFDSAWADRQPGAICAVELGAGAAVFHPPELVRFDGALAFINDRAPDADYLLVAIDQSTVVRNPAGMRPVERVAARLVSWMGGGVQPSNLGKASLFGTGAPIHRFLGELGAEQDPPRARTAAGGEFVVEVFPALALASLDAIFFGCRQGPRYNPARPTFRIEAWRAVAAAAARGFRGFALEEPARWCDEAGQNPQPRKRDQDRLDAMLCLLVALGWRKGAPGGSLMLGCREQGYMVLPASAAVRARIEEAAAELGVPVDGRVPPYTAPQAIDC